MRILCLLDSPLHQGDRWLWNHPAGGDDHVVFRDLSVASRRGRLTRVASLCALFYDAARVVAPAASGDCYDLLVAWENKAGLPLALMRWLRRVSTVPLVILTFAPKPYVRVARALVRGWLRNSTYVTVPSSWEANLCRKYIGLSGERVFVCHLGGYDLLRYRANPGDAPSDHSDGSYVFAGGLTDRDYETFLAAVSIVHVRCVVFAPRRKLPRFQAPPWVELNGLAPAHQYFSALACSSVVAVPLRPVQHAAGLTSILDAMSAGRAVVCSDTPVAREYVEDGVTGMLVPCGDVQAMRSAIAVLMEHPEMRREMGRAARSLYEEKFNFAAFADRVQTILHRVVQASSG